MLQWGDNMTNEFKGLVEEMAKGINFEDNAMILGTSILNEKDNVYDNTIHFHAKEYYPIECIVKSIVENFLKPLNDEAAEYAREMLLNIIESDKNNRAYNEE